MINETQKEAITQMITSVIAGDPSIFLVEVKIKPTNNVKVFLDGDSGISIRQCADYNRALYKLLEASALFPDGDYSLEVSSPGLDEPLKQERQYVKNIGRDVEVVTQDGAKIEGKLEKADAEGLVVVEEKGKNKKKEIIQHTIPFNNIKTTKIQIKF
ncbi:ribosome maturation factor RimP [Dinghuibacter silviterrae]|nr:ribosome maturation factor [Dinghuibacter silviterrae]